MTSLERARSFIQARAKAIAVTIVPLAAIAIAASQPARAANVLLFNSGGCNVTQQGVVAEPISECFATPIPGFQNNANGVKLSGDAQVGIYSGGFGSITFDITGSANGGTPRGLLPVTWDFTVGYHESLQQQPTSADSPLSYSLVYKLDSGSFTKAESGSLTFNTPCGDLTCAHVTGADTFGVDGPVSSYDISLTISGNFTAGSFLTVNIPNNSVDLNPTPEPASMALGLSGLLGLAFAGFRRRRKV
ncbi:MAG TPA: PEP-CTERM sorting domain-containing protein [Bryobacteraceae bacterium]|jgi:MYXO-CTERM domain-containing protein